MNSIEEIAKKLDEMSLGRNLSIEERAEILSMGTPLEVTFAHELGSEYIPADEIIEGIFTAGDGSVIYGDSNSGKTYLVIDMACALARGIEWMGRKTEPGMVIYLAAENPQSVIRRLQAYMKYHDVEVPNFAIVKSPIDLFNGEADTSKVIHLVKSLEKQYNREARLIIGDTLARLSAGANENAGQDMSLVVRHFDQIREETKAHFTLIHHCGKNAAAGARGWSGVRAAVDTEIEITDSANGRCMEITKQRDLSTKGERIGFKLESVTLGLTKWKSPATAAVVIPTDAPAKNAGKRLSEIGGAITELLISKSGSMKKADINKHFGDRYAKGSVYREIKKMVSAGLVSDMLGTVALIT